VVVSDKNHQKTRRIINSFETSSTPKIKKVFTKSKKPLLDCLKDYESMKNMKLVQKIITLSVLSLLSACAAKPDAPKYQIEDEKFYQRGVDGGRTEFVFIVTVAPTPEFKFEKGEPSSRRELEKFAEHERVEDSPALKIQLEEEAVERLKKTLHDRQLCRQGHKVDQVYWRDRSVQLRGGCYE
jgi:hypothetical protein